jgi:hypothetical protein
MTATDATTLTFTQALEDMVEMFTRTLKRQRKEAEGTSLTQLAQYNLFGMVSTEAQLDFYTEALRVTREYSEQDGRTQLAEALGRALTDGRRYTDTFANGVVEATQDAARTVLKGMRDYVDAATVLARAY